MRMLIGNLPRADEGHEPLVMHGHHKAHLSLVPYLFVVTHCYRIEQRSLDDPLFLVTTQRSQPDLALGTCSKLFLETDLLTSNTPVPEILVLDHHSFQLLRLDLQLSFSQPSFQGPMFHVTVEE